MTSPQLNTATARTLTLQDGTDTTKLGVLNIQDVPTGTTMTYFFPSASGSGQNLVSVQATQTLAAKTLTNPQINNPNVMNLRLQDGQDLTKMGYVYVDYVPTGTTRSYHLPEAGIQNQDIVSTVAVQTMSGKTLTSPTVTGGLSVDRIIPTTSARMTATGAGGATVNAFSGGPACSDMGCAWSLAGGSLGLVATVTFGVTRASIPCVMCSRIDGTNPSGTNAIVFSVYSTTTSGFSIWRGGTADASSVVCMVIG